jgi:hypothetical protein
VSKQTLRVPSALPRDYKTPERIKREKKENI